MNSRFCPYCGGDAQGAAFCPHCGASIDVAPVASAAQSPAVPSVFCGSCGFDVGDAMFCPSCGTSQAAVPIPPPQQPYVTPPPVQPYVAAPPPVQPYVAAAPPVQPYVAAPTPVQAYAAAAPVNAFCPSCGTQVEGGLTFCTNCGASMETGVPLAPSQYIRPPAKGSNVGILIGGGAVVAAIVVAFVIMSGGKDESSSSSTSSSSTTASQPAASSPSATRPASQPTTAAQASSALVAELPKPIAFDLPTTGPDSQLGPQDRATAKATVDALTAAKIDMKGISVYVYPVYGSKDTLLVLDVDSTQASQASSNQEQLAKVIGTIPALKTANVTRFVMNMTGKDAQGNYLLTVTMTMAALDGISNGTMPQAEVQKQMLGEVKRLP